VLPPRHALQRPGDTACLGVENGYSIQRVQRYKQSPSREGGKSVGMTAVEKLQGVCMEDVTWGDVHQGRMVGRTDGLKDGETIHETTGRGQNLDEI
jgi:hypothetical protein